MPGGPNLGQATAKHGIDYCLQGWQQSCHRRNNLKDALSMFRLLFMPMNPEEIVPEGAFAGVPRLRHVSVESNTRLIGAEAWQNCRQLCIVKLPATVVGISDNAFRHCKLLNDCLSSTGITTLLSQRILQPLARV